MRARAREFRSLERCKFKTKQWEDAELLNFTRLAMRRNGTFLLPIVKSGLGCARNRKASFDSMTSTHVGNCIRLYADIRDDVTFDAKSCFHHDQGIEFCQDMS
jgi:hypothetical protein